MMIATWHDQKTLWPSSLNSNMIRLLAWLKLTLFALGKSFVTKLKLCTNSRALLQYLGVVFEDKQSGKVTGNMQYATYWVTHNGTNIQRVVMVTLAQKKEIATIQMNITGDEWSDYHKHSVQTSCFIQTNPQLMATLTLVTITIFLKWPSFLTDLNFWSQGCLLMGSSNYCTCIHC